MKYFLLSFAFILINLISFAQFENFDLSKYKLPDMKRHQLDFNFNYSNNYRSYHYLDDMTTSKLSFDGGLVSTYSYLFNSRKKQSNFNVRLYSQMDFETDKAKDKDLTKNMETDLRLRLNFEERYYLKEDQFFIHVNPEAYVSFDRRKTSYYKEKLEKYESKNTNRNLDFIPKLEVGIGFGRIEPVGDFRQAIYILEDLYKNQRLERMPSENEVIQVAAKVSDLKNKRFFDSRLRKIYEIKSIDSLLNEMGLIENQDAVYFTSLNDLWLYGVESRLSGNRFQFDMNGGLHYSFQKEYHVTNYGIVNEEESKVNQNWESIGAEFSFDSYKNLNLKWQRYFTGTTSFLHYTQVRLNGEESLISTIQNRINIHIAYGYNWYLNTRTKASISARVFYSKSERKDMGDYLNEYLNNHIQGYISYYLSPKLRLHFYSGIYNRWNFDDYSSYLSSLSFSSSIGLRYAIF